MTGFTDLPFELRAMIYKHALASSPRVLYIGMWKYPCTDSRFQDSLSPSDRPNNSKWKESEKYEWHMEITDRSSIHRSAPMPHPLFATCKESRNAALEVFNVGFRTNSPTNQYLMTDCRKYVDEDDKTTFHYLAKPVDGPVTHVDLKRDILMIDMLSGHRAVERTFDLTPASIFTNLKHLGFSWYPGLKLLEYCVSKFTGLECIIIVVSSLFEFYNNTHLQDFEKVWQKQGSSKGQNLKPLPKVKYALYDYRSSVVNERIVETIRGV